jgi:hypothetical protein
MILYLGPLLQCVIPVMYMKHTVLHMQPTSAIPHPQTRLWHMGCQNHNAPFLFTVITRKCVDIRFLFHAVLGICSFEYYRTLFNKMHHFDTSGFPVRKIRLLQLRVYNYKVVSCRFNGDIFLVFVFEIHVRSYI